MQRLDRVPISPARPPALGSEAWAIADELGWAKTYDAEYVALARTLHVDLVSRDERLRRGAARLIRVITPDELVPPAFDRWSNRALPVDQAS